MRLLLIEDDKQLGDGIRAGLALEGYTVDWVRNGNAAEEALLNAQFDLVVLDLGLPHRSGIDILKELRARGDATPVLVLTARDTVADRIKGLDSGSDDYMTKPFDLDELSARVRALLRRSVGQASSSITHGNIIIDPAAHVVLLDGKPVEISPREFAILRILMSNIGRVLSRSRLEETLYGWETDVESNAVEVHIHHLRRKLGGNLIRTVRGVGYLIDKEES
ncbi:MAG: response regulator [Sulfuricaulis sp.]